MIYNEEEFLASVQQILTDFDFEPTIEESKQSALNKLNAVLFPLKDCGAIVDYQFIVKNAESSDQIDLAVCVVSSLGKEESWDFTIVNGNK